MQYAIADGYTDIRLGGHTVFEAFHEVMPNSFVIFTTAYDEFAMEAIHANGIDYLLKPFDSTDLQKAMQKVLLAPKTKTDTDTKGSLANLAQLMECYQEQFLVNKADELISIHANDICYFQIDDDKTLITTAQGEHYEKSTSLGEVEKHLDPRKFFRLNRKYIVNINHIRKISLFFNSKLLIRITGCDEDIVVSKERAAALKDRLNR